MALVSMKLDAAEAKAETLMSDFDEKPEYPYGLSINLDDVTLKKLGIDVSAVGTKFNLTATCEVCSTSQYGNQDGSTDKTMSLQITDMSLGGDSENSSSDMAQKLYG